MDKTNQVVSGNRAGRILATIQGMIIDLFMPVYLSEKNSTVGIFVCPDRNIRITVENIKKLEVESVENSN